MKIKINEIGKNPGTCGWLKTETETGRMYFCEGVTSDGTVGLWARYNTGERKKSMCLALYNPDNLEFTPMEIGGAGDDPWCEVNRYQLTPAACRAMISVARQWCDRKNAGRESDEELKIEVCFK